MPDQKSARILECDHGVDPVWYAAMMRKQREREKSDEYKKEQHELFLYKDLDVIEEILANDGNLTKTEGESIPSSQRRGSGK